MKKILLSVILVLLLINGTAVAEVYEGMIVARNWQTLLSESTGTVSSVNVREGDKIQPGDVLATLKPISIYSPIDGIVSTVSCQEGEKSEGEIIRIVPQSTYQIHCTADKAYREPDNQHIISGETLYVKCTKDGTHRAIGRVFQIEGAKYMLETTGGELYLGETVYLYRSKSMETASRVGIGTVVMADPEACSAEGIIVEMKVTEGDSVEKGQLLCRYLSAGSGILTARQKGIVSELFIKAGEQVQENAGIASVVVPEDMVIEIYVPEANIADIVRGMKVPFFYVCDRLENAQYATVLQIGAIPEENGYQVLLKPDTPPEKLGLNVEVRIEN